MDSSDGRFATTQWTLVWKAASEDSSVGRKALEQIIQRNWQPLYSFARRKGLGREDAEDATQEFLHELIRGDLLEKLDPARGKFRAFLLTAWKRFLIDDYRGKNAAKRGGDVSVFALDFGESESRWQKSVAREDDPEAMFNAAWATGLLDEARRRLSDEYSGPRAPTLTALSPFLTRTPDADAYDRLAEELQSSPGAVKVALHRLRQRYGTTLREVVLETIDDPTDLDSEISELIRIVGS